MRGDALASGAKSANFYADPQISEEEYKNRIAVPEERKDIFCHCKTCNFAAYTVKEFSDHIHYDCTTPVPWGNERPVEGFIQLPEIPKEAL